MESRVTALSDYMIWYPYICRVKKESRKEKREDVRKFLEKIFSIPEAS